jgi:shikimate kinase
MDVVVVGLPGSGKTAVGRRLATRHRATFVDIDAEIERDAGATIAEIFERDGEPAFRERERAAIEALGSADMGDDVARVIATGGGAIVDPRNRWRLYRGRRAFWLDAPAERLAARVRFGGAKRPLLQGGDPVSRLRELLAQRERFYAAAERIDGDGAPYHVLERLEVALFFFEG